MPKIGIAFDRLRSEEKMLQSEAASLGCDTTMIDAKMTQIDTESKAADFDFGDVVLERCVSYFRGLYLTSCLEFLQVPVLNRYEVASRCGNKLIMTLQLQRCNVPTPRTYLAFSKDSAIECISRTGYPLVIKPIVGSWGRGVMPIRDKDTIDAVIEARELTDSPHDRIYYLQEEVKRPPRDIRVITVGDRAIAAMYRMSSGDFKTNLAIGGDPHLCEITGELEDTAAKASQAAGGGILGIDMMEDQSRGLVVHEVNNTVEFKGLARVARRNIPKEMVEFAISQAKR